jgi:hypothetical protein
MKRVAAISLACVPALFQYSWGCQGCEAQASGALVEVLFDIITAPCSLLAVCLGVDEKSCTYPQKQRLIRSPQKGPVRPSRTATRVKKAPIPLLPSAMPLLTPRTLEGQPAQPPAIPVPAPPVRVQGEAPPQSESPPIQGIPPKMQAPPVKKVAPAPFTGPPAAGKPAPGVTSPRQPAPAEEELTPVPKKETAPAVPRVSGPPSVKGPETAKKPKPRKEGPPAPRMPVYPPACGPRLFFR